MNIAKKEAYELSGKDMKKLLGNVKILEYPELRNYTDINDVFDSQGRCVLFLIEQKDGDNVTGHWDALFSSVDKQGNKEINFFDSYGLPPNGWNKYVSMSIQKQLSEVNGTMLLPLLQKAKNQGYKVLYNHVKLQQMKPNVKTCGDFVSSRLLKKDLNNDEYIQFLDSLKSQYKVKTYDEAVCIFINAKLGR